MLAGRGARDAASTGWANTALVGIIIVEALHLYPIMLLNLQAALANLDPAMEQAAANLGAGALDHLPPDHAAADSAGAFCRLHDRR